MASYETGKLMQGSSGSDTVSKFIDELPPLRTARMAQGSNGEWREWTGIVESPDGERVDIGLSNLGSVLGSEKATGCLRITSGGITETTILVDGGIIYRDSVGNGHSSQLVPQLNFFDAVDGQKTHP